MNKIFDLNKPHRELISDETTTIIKFSDRNKRYACSLYNGSKVLKFIKLVSRYFKSVCRFLVQGSMKTLNPDLTVEEIASQNIIVEKLIKLDNHPISTLIQLNYANSHKIFYPAFQVSIKNIYLNGYSSIKTHQNVLFKDYFQLIYESERDETKILDFIEGARRINSNIVWNSPLHCSCAFAAAYNIASLIYPERKEFFNQKRDNFAFFMEPVYNIGPFVNVNENILSVQFLLAAVFEIQISDDYVVMAEMLQGVDPLCTLIFIQRAGEMGHYVLLIKNDDHHFFAIDHVGNYRGSFEEYKLCGYIYKSDNFKNQFRQQNIGTIKCEDINQFDIVESQEIHEILHKFYAEHQAEVDQSQDDVYNMLIHIRDTPKFQEAILVGKTMFSFWRNAKLGSDRMLTQMIQKQNLPEEGLTNEKLVVDISNYLNQFYFAQEDIIGKSEEVEVSEQIKIQFQAALDKGIKMSNLKSTIKTAKFTGFDKDGNALFQSEWYQTIEPIFAFADTPWAWLYSQNCTLKAGTLRSIYKSWLSTKPSPPQSGEPWPDDYVKAFFISLNEMINTFDKKDQILITAIETAEKMKEFSDKKNE